MKFHPLISHIGAALLGLALAGASYAQDYPSRSIKIIVPYAPGGQADSGVRVMAAGMSQLLNQPIVVENIGGSSGIAALQNVMKAPADGYTLVYQDPGHWAINPALYAKLPYDTLRDFAPVGLFATTALFLVTPASFPANNLQELVALVKSKPDEFTYASSGIGSPHHLTMEDFKAALGLKILHVPFKGTGQSVPAMVGGQVSMGIAALTSVSGFVKEGRIKLIAANTGTRSAFAPNVPTMAEAGISSFNHGSGLGLFAPAGTPRPVIDKLSSTMARLMASPDTVTRLAGIGLEPPAATTPEKLLETVREDKPKYVRIVKMTGTTVE